MDITTLKNLGKGKFGSVYLTTDKSTGEKYALKVFSKDAAKARLHWIREKNVFQALSCPQGEKYIICGHDYGEKPNFYYITMDYVDGYNLKDVIGCMMKSNMEFTENEYINFAKHLLEAIAYIHSKDIVHRDIKPANIMFTHEKLILVDYGLACFEKIANDCTISGTPLYLPPETTISQYKMTTKADIWAFGVTLYKFVYGIHPYLNKKMNDLKIYLKGYEEDQIHYSDMKPKRINDLIKACLQKYPTLRPSAQELLDTL